MSVKVKLSQVKAKASSKLSKTCFIVFICCFVFFLIGIGSGLYSASIFNKPTPTPIAVKRFQHLYNVEGSLETEIKKKVVPQVKDIADDTVQIVNEMVARLVRSERSIKPSKFKKKWKNSRISRPKRDLSSDFAPMNLDPIQHTEREAPLIPTGKDVVTRSKRRALEELRQELKLCRQNAGRDCGKIYEQISVLTDEIDQRFARMKSIVNELRPNSDTKTLDVLNVVEKDDKKRLKEDQQRKMKDFGLQDCSSEEQDGKNSTGCAIKLKDVFENETNIIHTKTKIYTKPSTIAPEPISLEPTTILTTTPTTTTSEMPTPPFPEDKIEESDSKPRALFTKDPPPPSYRNRQGHYMGHHPPPSEDFDSYPANDMLPKAKVDDLYWRFPHSHRGNFMDHNNLEENVEFPAVIQAETSSKNEKSTTTTTSAPEEPKIMGAQGPFMSVCEQFARQHGIQLDSSGTIISNNGNFQAQRPSSVGTQVPQTGQSSKASAQLFLNPGFNQMGMPLCYMAPQMSPQWNYGGFFGHSAPQMMNRPFSQVPFPGVFNNFGRSMMTPSAPGGNYYCAFMPNANQQIPMGFGAFRTSEAIAAEGNSEIIAATKKSNVPSETDIIYASFTTKPVKNMTAFQERASVSCRPGTIACAGTGQCIETSKWCDSRINCLDSSDEVACSCKARLPFNRICDGVTDCPMGDDELGCNGCDKYSFTCYSSQDEYIASHGHGTSMCFTLNDRCDGIRNCFNGKDERDCNVIVKNLGGYLSHQVSYSDGFLYRNFKGKWYPVCRNPALWAREACHAEVGRTDEAPRITSDQNAAVVGPFISNKGDALRDPVIEDHCNAPTYVVCPQMKCGRVKSVHDSLHTKKKRRHTNTTITENREKEHVSIVGGTDCAPHQWPFIVSIFKNGRHHCGGAIKSAQWIITAAHCFHSYHKNYYEVRAGSLRHRSYNPEVQISPIVKVFVYPKYDQKAMVEDIALVKIAAPLNFNRYVRPICLPAPGRSGTQADWVNGPPVGQVCSVMGWGTLAEDGPHADGLKETHLPILETCKNNNRGKSICAGELSGGRDACQGDSGGPLLCKSLHDPEEWYLAGVVSHGEGCARAGTAGIYTRVSHYLIWLDKTEAEDGEPGSYPITQCTGFKCIWGGGKCLPKNSRCNGVVECLGGEDEVDCPFTASQLRSMEDNQFRDEEATTVVPKTTSEAETTDFSSSTTSSTTVAAETTVETTSSTTSTTTEAPTELPTSPETTSEATSSTASVTTTPETTTEAKTEPKTEVTVPETTSTSTTTTTTTTTEAPSTTVSSTTQEETTISTSTSTVALSTASRDGRQLDFMTSTLPSTTVSVQTTTDLAPVNDSGRHLFPIFATSATTAPTVPTTRPFLPLAVLPATTVKPVINKRLTLDPHGDTFHCQNIPQSINRVHRCDKQLDCEDGTDERNCTCRDFLVHQHPHKICDGIVDCVDLTDEEGCLLCSPDQFKCRLSKTCVNLANRCNNVVDCEHKEDELDCISLTNGVTVLVTPDNNPVLKSRGYLTHNHRGKWTIHCGSTHHHHENRVAELVGQTCISLGFAGYSDFKHVNFGKEKNELGVQIVEDPHHDARRTIAQEQVSLVNMRENNLDIESVAMASDCVALWIECVPHTSSNKTNVVKPLPFLRPHDYERPTVQPSIVPHVVVPVPHKHLKDKLNETIGLSEHQWAFSAVVFAEGKPICNGILLARQWVMVEGSCLKLHRLETDHIAVLLGSSNSFLHIQGPYEVVSRVDCIREVPQSNVLLLHLEYPVVYNRYVLPTYLIDSTDREVETEECQTVSIDKFGRLRAWAVRKKMHACPAGYKCFEDHHSHHSHHSHKTLCELKDFLHRPGYVICRTKSSSWFPTGFYHNLHSLCGTDNRLTVLTLNPKHFTLLNVIGKRKSLNIKNPLVQNMSIDFPHDFHPDHLHHHDTNDPSHVIDILETLECQPYFGSPLCNGHRCPFGVCLAEKHVCDGVVHCHDASDEAAEICVGRKKRQCNHHELTCRNGNCVEKSRFCNQINDCGDYTDEPRVCSCYEYLRVTDPDKICDGIRNCLDKSDENNEECRCHPNRFRCGQTLKCIPHDFVCDGDHDCPGGEDESYCYGIQNNHMSDGYYEVMQQEFGVWHTKCFPKSKPPTQTDLIEICRKMGYIDPKYPKARARVDNETVMAILPNSDNSQMEFVREERKLNTTHDLAPATKAIISNKFSTLQVNDDIKLYVKPSRPLASLVEWDKNDEKNCFRVEINCGAKY
ncbi:serine protease nudel [Culicoides brevitarsis]|uniref:serine protease nudel n=1 Tax=Culicoides brevitarsis TaxID=469753 RepID=UPI00307BB5D6